MMIIAETERLQLSLFTLNDASFFQELTNTPNWIKYIGDRNLKTIKDAEGYLINGTLKSYSDFGFGFYKIELKSENFKSIGTCGLIKRPQLDDVDIGFAFLPKYEGFGYGYESSLAVMELAKNTFNLEKLLAITLPINVNSIKLIEKLGFELEKRVNVFGDDKEVLLFTKTL